MTTEARLRELLAAATPGEWRVESADDPESYLAGVVEEWHKAVDVDDADDPGIARVPSWIVAPDVLDFEDDGGFIPKIDAELAVAAVNALPKLLAVVKAADVLVDEIDWTAGTNSLAIRLTGVTEEFRALRAALAALDEGGAA